MKSNRNNSWRFFPRLWSSENGENKKKLDGEPPSKATVLIHSTPLTLEKTLQELEIEDFTDLGLNTELPPTSESSEDIKLPPASKPAQDFHEINTHTLSPKKTSAHPVSVVHKIPSDSKINKESFGVLNTKIFTEYTQAENKHSRLMNDSEIEILKISALLNEAKDADATNKYYYKELEAIMAQLEAFAANCYHYFCPGVTFKTNSRYDINTFKISGVSSKAAAIFNDLSKSAFTADDLKIECFDKIDNEFNAKIDKLREQKNAILSGHDIDKNLIEKIKLAIKQLKINKDIAIASLIEDIETIEEEIAKHNLFPDFPQKNPEEILVISGKGISVSDLKKYRTKKAWAEIFTFSFIFCEDDLHILQVAIDRIYGGAHRIDYDMSFWTLFSKHKILGPIDLYLRKPMENAFEVSPQNINSLPAFTSGGPFYNCTEEIPSRLTDYAYVRNIPGYEEILRHICIKSYGSMATEFKKLIIDPVFIYHKFKNMLKFISAKNELFTNIAKMHVSENVLHQDNSEQTFISAVTDFMDKRINDFTIALEDMREFKTFLELHPEAFNRIKAEFIAQNDKIDLKIKKLDAKIKKFPHKDKKSARLQLIKEAYLRLKLNISELEEKYNNHKILTLSKNYPKPERILIEDAPLTTQTIFARTSPETNSPPMEQPTKRDMQFSIYLTH